MLYVVPYTLTNLLQNSGLVRAQQIWADERIANPFINALRMTNPTRRALGTMNAAFEVTEYFRVTGTKVLYHLQPAEDKAISIREVVRFLSEFGNTQNQIAEVLNYTHQNVQKFIK